MEMKITKEVWGENLDILVEADSEVLKKCGEIVDEKVNFLNENKQLIFEFLNDEVVFPVVEGTNDAIKENGDCTLPDKIKLTEPITEKMVEEALFITHISVELTDDDC